MSLLTPPIIILVHPQMGENIGAAARVMANFGLSELRLVKPRQRWPNKKALAMATHAAGVVENAVIYKTLEEALADTTAAYAMTLRTRDMEKPCYTSYQLPHLAESHSSERWACVFGPENNGLDNQMVSLCSGIITIPTIPAYGSMNLAQAICVLAYEWQRFASTAPGVTAPAEALATFQETEGCAAHLIDILDQHHYFRAPDKRPGMETTIRNLFHNHPWTAQQVRTWRGMWRCLGRE